MHKIKEEIKIEEIELKVLNLEGMIEFYEQILGFKVVKESDEYAILGSNKNPFLKLLRDEKSIKEEFNSVGLHHVAYLLPTRKDLAIMLKHLLEKEATIEGFADHLVSEAIYLHDIEGNGIEIYCDKPRNEWIRIGNKIAMSTEPLDIEGLLKLANEEFKGMSDETRIGHIHLKVSSLSRTENFYIKALGLDLTFRYYGAIFLSSGGYHHHVGANVWQSLGAPPRKENMRGLSYFTIKLPSKEDFEGIMKNLGELGIAYAIEGEKIKIKDPDNIDIILKT